MSVPWSDKPLLIATWTLTSGVALGFLWRALPPNPSDPLTLCGGVPPFYLPPLDYGYFCTVLLLSLLGGASVLFGRGRFAAGSAVLRGSLATAIAVDGLAAVTIEGNGAAPFFVPAAVLGVLHLLVAGWSWVSRLPGRGWKYARRALLVPLLVSLVEVGVMVLLMASSPFTAMGMMQTRFYSSGADVPSHLAFVPNTAHGVRWFAWDAEVGAVAVAFRFDAEDAAEVRRLVSDVNLSHEIMPGARGLRRCGFDLYDHHSFRAGGLAAVKWDAGIAYFLADGS